MFDFQKEVIINSNVLEDGVTPRFLALTGQVQNADGTLANSLVPKTPIFRVLRCMDYVKDGLVNGVVWKTTGQRGSVAKAIFNAPNQKGIYRVIIGLSLDEKYLSDYAMPWYRFAKPVLAEFTLTDSNLSEAAKIMAKAIKLAIPENYEFLKISVSGSQVTVTCVDTYQMIVEAKLQSAPEAACPADLCDNYEDYGTQPNKDDGTLVKNEMQTGTGTWLQENLRFPSYANLRYKALNSEEYPIASALYNQYSFQYCVPRRGLHGQGTVGQKLVSVTTHTFYVLQELATDFETAINTAFGDVITPVNTPKYTLNILSDQNLNPTAITNGNAILQATVDDEVLTTDATSFNWKLINAPSKYQIERQSDGSGKITVSGGTPDEGDSFAVEVTYKGSFTRKQFYVTSTVGYVQSVTATWESNDLKVVTALSSTQNKVTKLMTFGSNVTLVKDNVTDPGKVAYVDKSTLSLTLPDVATVTFALADLGLEAKAAVTVTIDGKTSTASAD
jgi:hypothetical protein